MLIVIIVGVVLVVGAVGYLLRRRSVSLKSKNSRYTVVHDNAVYDKGAKGGSDVEGWGEEGGARHKAADGEEDDDDEALVDFTSEA